MWRNMDRFCKCPRAKDASFCFLRRERRRERRSRLGAAVKEKIEKEKADPTRERKRTSDFDGRVAYVCSTPTIVTVVTASKKSRTMTSEKKETPRCTTGRRCSCVHALQTEEAYIREQTYKAGKRVSRLIITEGAWASFRSIKTNPIQQRNTRESTTTPKLLPRNSREATDISLCARHSSHPDISPRPLISRDFYPLWNFIHFLIYLWKFATWNKYDWQSENFRKNFDFQTKLLGES